MPTDDRQAASIAAYILPRLYAVTADYDERKYPPGPLVTFRRQFASLHAENPCIAEAMIWKWGSWNAVGYPSAHARLIEEIERAWTLFVTSEATATPAASFEWWMARFERPTTYVTSAWIAHLVHHRSGQPIIGRYNFRAMNHLLCRSDPSLRVKRQPSTRRDIERLSRFLDGVLEHLPDVDRDTLDRFLTAYGKHHVPKRWPDDGGDGHRGAARERRRERSGDPVPGTTCRPERGPARAGGEEAANDVPPPE